MVTIVKNINWRICYITYHLFLVSNNITYHFNLWNWGLYIEFPVYIMQYEQSKNYRHLKTVYVS